jgi:hypothetical protein
MSRGPQPRWNFYTSRSVSIEAIVPVGPDHEIRVLLDLTQPTMTMTQTFEVLREALEKRSGQDQRRTQDDEGFEHESIKDDADVKAIHDDALTSRLSSKPNQCIYLYDHYLRKKMEDV